MVDAMNVTTGIASMSSTPSWFNLMIIVGFVSIIISLFVMSLTSVNVYFKGRKFVNWLISTIKYFFIGISVILVLGLIGLIVYYFIHQAQQGNTVPVWMTLSIIAGYFIISLIGWIFKTFIYERIKLFELEFKEIERENVP